MTFYKILKEMFSSKKRRGFPVRWDGPYNEAKDDAVIFCGNPKCDEYIENEDWKYCPFCGVRLLLHGRDIFI